jgi:4-hydroxy-tetrahydrodipicolinate reductase
MASEQHDGTRLRVIQWATGNVGRRALREVIRHPSLELVGVLTYDPAKDGVDAGTLCGEVATGITATTDRAAIHALDADCVLYMPQVVDLDDVVAFLDAGTNISTTCVEFFNDGRPLGDGRAQVLDACARGGTSVYATGSSPGFITEIFPYALLSLQRRVNAFDIYEFANMSRRDSPHMIFEQIGFGKPMDGATMSGAPKVLESSPQLAELARAAGLVIDRWTTTSESAAASHATEVVAGKLDAGTVGARRIIVAGERDGKPLLRWIACWYLTEDLDADWELGATGWRVKVDGDAPLAIDMPFPIPIEDLNDFTPAYTANPAVNAVPYVVAARPGILSTRELPPIVPAGPGGPST